MSDDPNRDVTIFTEALGLPPEQRAEFLDRACHGDENLRNQVLALLSAHERVGDFLEKPPFEAGPVSGAETQYGNGEPGADGDEDGLK